MAAYYNEIDGYAAEWLRNLIRAGHIAPGEVDERDIKDVRPDDVRGFTQCHWFAGIGGWPYALRLAGWPDSRPVWTGSCPCQPFSQAGEGLGFADERHLWPYFHWLIAQLRPADVIGEQVASKNVDDWIDLVQSDMEALGYAFGSVPFPSAGIGAPHIRDRNYWMAHANNSRSQGRSGVRQRRGERVARSSSLARGLADADRIGHAPRSDGRASMGHGQTTQSDCCVGELGHADGAHQRGVGRGQGSSPSCPEIEVCGEDGQRNGIVCDRAGAAAPDAAGPTNGFWRVADWLFCRDEKWRPVEPGTFPLVAGLPAGMGKLSPEQRRLAELAGLDAASLKRAKAYRVGTLRGYGNAINVEAAAAFIEAADEALSLTLL